MTQQQQLALLNSIMPDILETKDPKGVMLKCAREHNLSPAQLEHLGQCFNTAKTLVGLEKQANRGDSFTIVNVPEMLSEYVTYDAHKSGKPDATSKKVTKLMKFAHTGVQEEAETGNRYYDPIESLNRLPSLFTLKSVNDVYEPVEDMDKSASSIQVVEEPSLWKEEECVRNMKQIAFETTQEIKEKCASLCREVHESGDWQEMAEDALSYFGDVANIAIDTVEDYASKHNIALEPFELNKVASKRALAYDRHKVMPLFGAMLKYAHYKMHALDILESFNPGQKKQASEQDTIESLLDAIHPAKKPQEDLLTEKQGSLYSTATSAGKDVLQKSVMPRVESHEQYINQAKQKADETIAVQQLMLEDPVIKEADPQEVYELYKTVASLSPTLAQRPTTLAPIVREALQYGSLPIQTVTALLNAESTAAKTKHYNRED